MGADPATRAVPRRLIWDNEPGIGQKGRLAQGVAAFAGTLATKVVQLRPYDPESKGIVERRNGWFETSFMPGRTFTSPADFNAQLADWLEKANSRVVRTIKARPVDLIEHDRSRMLPLPPIPLQLGWRERVRLGRDYYVRLDASDYSVDPQAIGRIVDVTADLDRVRSGWTGGSSPTTPGSGRAGAPSPTRRMSRRRNGCGSSSSSPALPPSETTSPGISRTTTGRSGSKESRDGRQADRVGQADHLSRRRAQSTPDHRSRRPDG